MPAKVNVFQTCMSEVGESTQVLHIYLHLLGIVFGTWSKEL